MVVPAAAQVVAQVVAPAAVLAEALVAARPEAALAVECQAAAPVAARREAVPEAEHQEVVAPVVVRQAVEPGVERQEVARVAARQVAEPAAELLVVEQVAAAVVVAVEPVESGSPCRMAGESASDSMSHEIQTPTKSRAKYCSRTAARDESEPSSRHRWGGFESHLATHRSIAVSGGR